MVRAILWIAVSSGKQAEADKESLPEQERMLRSIAEREGWEIVDLITIPGHSRVYYNFLEFADAAEKEGIPGPQRMFKHWSAQDFDVFACIDGSRFGREQSIFAEVVARTIDIGAQVFSVKDGYIHRGNRRMYVSMAGYSASSEIDELVRRRQFGMRNRAEKGLKLSARTLFGMREVRDDRGKVIRQEPDPNLRYIFDKLAFEILQGTPWYKLEEALFERYGIAHTRDGQRFPNGTFRSLLFTPTFWGHTAMGMGKNKGLWVFDESAPIPPGVQIWRNTHEPIIGGATGKAVQQEIRRRSEVVRGRASGRHTHLFSGLVICGRCDTYLGVCESSSGSRGMRCQRHYNTSQHIAQECDQSKRVNIKRIRHYVNGLLQAMLEADDPDAVLGKRSDKRADIERLMEQITHEESALNNLVAGLRTIDAGNYAFKTYTAQIEQLGNRLQAMHQELDTLKAQESARERRDALRNLDDVRRMTLDAFWELPEREINQKLHAIFSPYKFVALDGDIIQVREVTMRRSRATGYPSKR